MQFISTHPILFLILMIAFAITAIVLQVKNFKKTAAGMKNEFENFGKKEPINLDFFGEATSRLIPIAICGFLAGLSGICFLIGAVNYFIAK